MVALHEVPLATILYFIVVSVSLSVAETVRLSLVPATVVVIVGAVPSTVIESSVEVAEVLPAASVALAVMSYAVALAARSMFAENRLVLPVQEECVVSAVSVTGVENDASSFSISTVLFASAQPVIVRSSVVFVMLSVLLEPVSSSEARSRVIGFAGFVVSTVIPVLL